MQTESRIIVALDYADAESALAVARTLDPSMCRVKVGKELFTASGPAVVDALQKLGFEVFLDLKFHDIPNTVAAACRAAARLGVWMVNVHASGGERMMIAAREALERSTQRPLLIAVTVLTSMGADELQAIGMQGTPQETVMRLAEMAQKCGLDGVVCSAREAAVLRQQLGERFCLVTPGIRPAGSAADDQTRIMTPAEAIAQGSHYLVIGRPVTQAADPVAVLQQINKEIEQAGGKE